VRKVPARRIRLVGEADLDVLGVTGHTRPGKPASGCRLLADRDGSREAIHSAGAQPRLDRQQELADPSLRWIGPCRRRDQVDLAPVQPLGHDPHMQAGVGKPRDRERGRGVELPVLGGLGDALLDRCDPVGGGAIHLGAAVEQQVQLARSRGTRRELAVDVADVRTAHDRHIKTERTPALNRHTHRGAIGRTIRHRSTVPIEHNRLETPLIHCRNRRSPARHRKSFDAGTPRRTPTSGRVGRVARRPLAAPGSCPSWLAAHVCAPKLRAAGITGSRAWRLIDVQAPSVATCSETCGPRSVAACAGFSSSRHGQLRTGGLARAAGVRPAPIPTRTSRHEVFRSTRAMTQVFPPPPPLSLPHIRERCEWRCSRRPGRDAPPRRGRVERVGLGCLAEATADRGRPGARPRRLLWTSAASGNTKGSALPARRELFERAALARDETAPPAAHPAAYDQLRRGEPAAWRLASRCMRARCPHPTAGTPQEPTERATRPPGW
jgi:hypothetical protein